MNVALAGARRVVLLTGIRTKLAHRLRPVNRLRYILEAGLAIVLVNFFRLMPHKLGSAIGGALARVVGPMLAVSKVGLENIAQAFPEKSPRQQRRILRGAWDNLGRTIAELPNLDQLQDATFLEAWPPSD